MKQDSCSVQNLTQIHASQVTIEITDAQSGNQFTRILPMEYYENANGIRLIGENLNGQPVEMVFLSEQGMFKMKDLSGHGADHSQCDD